MRKFFTALSLILFAAYSLAHAEPAPTNNIPASELPDVLLGYFDYSKTKKINYNNPSDNEIDYVISKFDKKSGGLIEIQRLSSRKYRFYNFPQISPDNTRLLYLSENKIYALDLNTLKKTQLSPNNKKTHNIPVWSPDGSNVAYESYSKSEYSESDWEIVIADINGKNKNSIKSKSVDSGYSLIWSPDSKKIAYTSWGTDEEPAQVFVISLENNREYQITKAPNYGFAPTWSPDSKKIAYISKGEEIYISNYDGKNQQRLTETYFDSGCSTKLKLNDKPQWAPNGNRIIFRTDRHCSGYSYDHYMVDLNSKEQTNLEVSIGMENPNEKWSPEGRYIFYYYLKSPHMGGLDLKILDAQTGQSNLIKRFFPPISDNVNFSIVKDYP